MINILYIGGYGRSGSTLLDTYLSAHPNIQGTGELTHLLLDGSLGNLGPEWTAILERAHPDSDWLSLHKISRGTEMRKQVSSAALQQYGSIWIPILREAGVYFKCITIVDSSKSTRESVYRPLRMKQIGFDVAFIALYRDLDAVIYSTWKRGSNLSLENGAQGNLWLRPERTTISYALTYFRISSFLLPKFADNRKMYLSYERFTAAPEEALMPILISLGVDPKLLPDSSQRFASDNFAVRGNRMRRAAPTVQIKVDKLRSNDLSTRLRLDSMVGRFFMHASNSTPAG